MSFSPQTIEAVWQKAAYVDAKNEANGFRKDQCGAWIQRPRHGDRNSPYGWEVDHIMPVVHGGSDDVHNLRPLHWRNNAATSDDGRLRCVVASTGSHNTA